MAHECPRVHLNFSMGEVDANRRIWFSAPSNIGIVTEITFKRREFGYVQVTAQWHISRSLLSLGGLAIITWGAYTIFPVNSTTAGFAYLLLVLAVASVWGFFEAMLTSVIATLTFNFFFFEPRLTFTIADPQNWVALFAFLSTAVLGSRLSEKAKRRAADALDRQRDLERLYTFGRSILLVDDKQAVAQQLAEKLADAFDLSAAALFDPRTGEIHRAGPLEFEGMDTQLREAALQGTVFADSEHRRVITAIRLGSDPIASLAVQGARMSDSVLQSVANLVAIGLERARAQDLARQAEVTQRGEQLRASLIDAMAHELKTPLTSIRAATTGLLANVEQKTAGDVRMLRIADEEAARLEELIDSTLDLAQLESGQIHVDLEFGNLEDAVQETVNSMRLKIGDRHVDVASDGRSHNLAFDLKLMKVALRQLLDNALKYSPSREPVLVRTSQSGGRVLVEITDHGKGIPVEEQSRIFERFYRSASVEGHAPGSGLGLSIAQRIVRAQGGDITVQSHPGETTFRVELPVKDGTTS